MRISCAVVCYHNPAEQIAQVLASVTSSSVEVALYVVDNSADNRLAATAEKFGATYIHLPHNPGFGSAHNRAIQEASGLGLSYHLVLNPDIRFATHVIHDMLNYMEQQQEIGMMMPKVYYPDGKQQYLCKMLPTPVDLVIRRFLPALYKFSGRLAWYEMHASGYDKIMDVPALSGCFMLMRHAVLQKTGGFDERFFMYMEDVDLSRRIGNISRSVYFPHVSVVHEYGKGSYKSLRLLYYHARSAIQYFNKWGWFFDRDKTRVNQSAMQKIHLMQNNQK